LNGQHIAQGEVKIIIDPHVHIASKSFVRDVHTKHFGSLMSIEKGNPWELLVVRINILASNTFIPPA